MAKPNITYNDLLDELLNMDPVRLNDDIVMYSIHDNQYYPVCKLTISDHHDKEVMEEGHMVLESD
jgi:hypothetical protein